jgi:hypothetical protein
MERRGGDRGKVCGYRDERSQRLARPFNSQPSCVPVTGEENQAIAPDGIAAGAIDDVMSDHELRPLPD